MRLSSLMTRLQFPADVTWLDFGAPVANFAVGWSAESNADDEGLTFVQSPYLSWHGFDWLAYVHFRKQAAAQLLWSVAQLPWAGAYDDLFAHLSNHLGPPAHADNLVTRWYAGRVEFSLLPPVRGAVLIVRPQNSSAVTVA